MYDLEVTNPKHNFLLPNGVVTSNSHSICYATNAYVCAFLKHHFPLEWWCAVLQNADKNEIAESFWKYCSSMVDPPDIALSGDNFEIINNRIRAPLSFLMGVGAGAHKELVSGRPFKDIDDFCDKIAATKEAKTVTNAETGKTRKGTSALNSGIVTKMIVSGVMDSLFPPRTDLYGKLDLYSKSLARALKKKKPEPIDEKFINLNPLKLYQIRKEILAIYSENLLEKVPALKIPEVRTVPVVRSNGEKINTYRYMVEKGNGFDDYLFVTANGFKAIAENELYPLPCRVAVIGYVMAERKFTFQQNKQALDLTIEVNGDILNTVKWPSFKTGKLGNYIWNRDCSEPLEGAIIVTLMSKWTKGKKFNIDRILIVEPPIQDKKNA